MSHFINWQGIPKEDISKVKLEFNKFAKKPYLKQERVKEDSPVTTDSEEDDQQVPSTSDEEEVDKEGDDFASKEDYQKDDKPPVSLPPPVHGKIEGERRFFSAKEKAVYAREVLEKGKPAKEVGLGFGVPSSTPHILISKEEPASGQKANKISPPVEKGKEHDQLVPGDISTKKYVVPINLLAPESKGGERKVRRPTRTYSPEEKIAYVKEILEEGRRTSDVCLENDLVKGTVDGWLRKAREAKVEGGSIEEAFNNGRRSYSMKIRAECIYEVLVNKKTQAQVASEHSIPPSTLSNWIKNSKEGKEGYEIAVTPPKSVVFASLTKPGHELDAVPVAIKEGYETVAVPALTKQVNASAPVVDSSEKKITTRRNYNEEFKAKLVTEVLEKGKTVSSVVKEFDIPRSTLDNWVRKARA